MAILVALYAAHQVLGLGGRSADDVFDRWVNGVLLWGAAVACAAAALRAERGRLAWWLAALALASWAIGDTIWSIRFADVATPPATSVSDVFWLAWYPLIIAALVLLIRERVAGFEFHRWIDGIAVMLLVATPWVALFLQPVAEHSGASGLTVVVDFAYPLGDALLVGTVLGVFAVMDWHPGRMWLTLGIALTVMGVVDAIASADALAHVHDRGIYDAAWAGAAVLVAYAAWQPHPGRLDRRELIGWRAIALAVAAQVLAASIQTYAIFDEIPASERILTVIVLMIATVQIVITRPRSRREARPADSAPDPPAPVVAPDPPAPVVAPDPPAPVVAPDPPAPVVARDPPGEAGDAGPADD
jgi:hypothetical protein